MLILDMAADMPSGFLPCHPSRSTNSGRKRWNGWSAWAADNGHKTDSSIRTVALARRDWIIAFPHAPGTHHSNRSPRGKAPGGASDCVGRGISPPDGQPQPCTTGRSEVALDAHLAGHRVLVLELVQRRRLRSGRREHRAAGHMLV